MHILLPSGKIAILPQMGPRVSTTVTMVTVSTLALNTKCSLAFKIKLFAVDMEGFGAIIMVRYRIAAFRGLGLQIMVSLLPGEGVGIFKTCNGQLVAGVGDVARPISHRAHYINLHNPRALHKCNSSSLSNNKHPNPKMTIILSDRRRTFRSKIRVETKLVRKIMVLEKVRKCHLLRDSLQRVHKQRKDPSLVLLSRQRLRLHLQPKLCQTLCRR